MVAEVGGTVTNAFESRSITSQISAGMERAAEIASGAISSVDTVLTTLQTEGSGALATAIAAISDLSKFSPKDVKFNYEIPDYIKATFLTPPSFRGDGALAPPARPTSGELQFQIVAALPDPLSVQAPTIGSLPTFPAPTVPSVSKPEAPSIDGLSEVPDAPIYADPIEPQLSSVIAPVLKALSVPSFTMPKLDSFDMPQLPELPPPLEISNGNGGEFSDYKVTYDRAEAARKFRRSVHNLLVLFSPRLRDREQFAAVTTWSSRGQQLSDDTLTAQATYHNDMSALMAAGEESQLQIDRFISERDAMWTDAKVQLAQHKEVDFEVNVLKALQAGLERDEFIGGAFMDAMKAGANLYNGLLAQFRLEVELYKTGIRIEMADLQKWRAEVEAETAKTRLNSQLAQNYATLVQAETTKTALYEARVQALFAKVSAYRSRMEAFATQAEVARTKLAVFKGTVDAYNAELTGYKAQYQAFAAQTRGVSAQNQIEQAKVSISTAEMQAAGADAQAASLVMEIESEQLKLQARQQAASFENFKLNNTFEAISAQIQGNIGRKNAIEWGSNVQINDVVNDAIAQEGQAAARYFTAASDSAYRASEQAFRAMITSTQAAAIAQEGAGRAAASLAQGAYSAVHANANLQGSGRVVGDEEERATSNLTISDFLDYEDSIQKIASV